MLKTFVAFFLTIASAQNTFSQDKCIGYWTGTMKRGEASMDVSFELRISKQHWIGYYNSSSQKASGIPLDSIQCRGDSLNFQLMSEPVTIFRCISSGNNISGTIIQQGFSNGNIALQRSPIPTKNILQSDTVFNNGDHVISCRLYFPRGNGKFPAVIFMHGSGGEGKYANQFIAEYLASKGIITLIQDKRGVGNSTGDWTKASFDDLANDYTSAVKFLKGFNKVNKLQIGIYGHSQGGTIAPLVASKSKEVSFVIAAASVGDSVYKQDLYRVENSLRSDGFQQIEILEAMSYYKSWLEIARTGLGIEKLDSINKYFKDRKWMDWVQAPPKEHWIWKYYLKTGNYNSLAFWKMVDVPVLLVYGENDQIEDIKLYLNNIDSVLIDQNHNKDVTQMILPKAQHNLCIEPGKDDKFFWWHISPGYPDIISSWILYRFKK